MIENELLEELKKINIELKKITAAISEQTFIIEKQYSKVNHDKRIDNILWK